MNQEISFRCTFLKGFVVNKWSFFKAERLHRAWLFVRLSWGNTGGLSSVTGWTWSVTCISVLSLSTEGGVYPWPVCAKEQEKYPSCMFILRAIILVYWTYVNTWVYQMYSFFNLEKRRATATKPEVYKNHRWYTLSAPSLMHDLDPACTAWKENESKKNQSARCAIIQHRSGQVVQGSFSAETSAKNCILQAKHAHVQCAFFSTLDTVFIIWILKKKWFQNACRVLPAESKMSSLCAQHVFKKNKNVQNVKLEIQDLC